MSDEPEAPATEDVDKPLPRVTLEQALDDSGVLERWAAQHAREVSQELANRETARLLAAWDATRPSTLDLAVQRGMLSASDWGSHPQHAAGVRMMNSWGDGNHAPYVTDANAQITMEDIQRAMERFTPAAAEWRAARERVHELVDNHVLYSQRRLHMHRLLFQVFNDAACDDWTQARVSGSRWVLRVNRAHLSDSTVGELCRLAFAVDCELRRVGVAELQGYIHWWALCDRLRQFQENCSYATADTLEALLLAAQTASCEARNAKYDVRLEGETAPRREGDHVPTPFGTLLARSASAEGEPANCGLTPFGPYAPQPDHGSVRLEPRVSDDGVVLVWKQEASDGTQQATQ